MDDVFMHALNYLPQAHYFPLTAHTHMRLNKNAFKEKYRKLNALHRADQ